MAILKYRTREDRVMGAPLVLELDEETDANDVLVTCIAGGPISIEGSSGKLFPGHPLGLNVTPRNLSAGQFFRWTSDQYVTIKITIPVGCKYSIDVEG